MRGFEHFILKHIVLDKSFNIISEKIFDPSKDRAYSKHDISGYSDSLFILSICNLHDTWLEPIKYYNQMLQLSDTKIIGFRGLLEQNLKKQDFHHALIYAEEIYKIN